MVTVLMGSNECLGPLALGAYVLQKVTSIRCL